MLVKSKLEKLKVFLDPLVLHYKTAEFIANDPLQFPHRALHQSHDKAGKPNLNDQLNCEVVGLLAALLSYGQRPLILKTIEQVLGLLDHDPLAHIQAFDSKELTERFAGFNYRFNQGADIVWLLGQLSAVFQQYDSLEAFWIQQAKALPDKAPLQSQLAAFTQGLITLRGPLARPPERAGLLFLLPNAALGGSCKRLHLWLRWMVRQENPLDGTHPLDFGLWKTALHPAELLVPLDVHVSRLARLLGLTQRKTDNWKTAEEITGVFRQLCPEDPLRYDFALFGLGVSGGLEGDPNLIPKSILAKVGAKKSGG